MNRWQRFKISLEELCEWIYNAMGQGEHEMGAPCPACGRSMLYAASDNGGSYYRCPSCGKVAYRRRE